MRLPLITRVILALLLVGVVPLAVVLTDRAQVHQTLRDNVLAAQILAARTRAERVSELLRRRTLLARTLANHPAVSTAPGSAETSGLLAGMLQAEPELVAIVLHGADGTELLRAQRREHVAAIDQVLQAPATYLETETTAWLRSRSALPDGQGDVVLVSFAGDLADVLNPQEIGNAVDQAILDTDGALVTGTITSTEQLPTELFQRALTSGQIGSGVFGDGDRRVLGAYFPIPGTSWIVVSQQRVEVAEAQARRMDRLSLLAIVGALLLIAVTTTAAYATVVRPIRRLLSDQQRLIGFEATGGGDEIDQLRASLEILERHLNDREQLDKVFLGRYQVIDVLGEGGMGTVFRAWDPVLQRPVALKTVRVSKTLDESERGEKVAALLGEAVTIARINHPNVVAVFDVQQERSAGFIAMELVDGLTLEAYQKLRGPLEVQELLPLAVAMASGLQAAHAQGIVHHDVKPGNILLGWDGTIKVVDFGIARFASELAPESGRIFGTPGYLPPEAITGRGYAEPGDWFSLGVILYECLTGQRLYRGAHMREMLMNTVRQDVTPIQAQRPDVPNALAELIDGLLEKQPSRRLGRAQDLIPRLEALSAEPWSVERLRRMKSKQVNYEKSQSVYCPFVDDGAAAGGSDRSTDPFGGTAG